MTNEPILYPTGVDATPDLTPAQVGAVRAVVARHGLRYPVEISPSFGCIMIQVPGMVLGIEPDGYTHS